MKKEFLIFVVLFIVLSLGMHMNQWITHPLEHLTHITTHKMPYHPLLYTAILYVVVGLVRLLFFLILKPFRHKNRY